MMRKCCAFVKKSETIAFVWNHKNMKVKIVVIHIQFISFWFRPKLRYYQKILRNLNVFFLKKQIMVVYW